MIYAKKRSAPVSYWKEWDIIDGEKVETFVAILRTSGCYWARKKGCFMCGYNIESDPRIDIHDIHAQIDELKEAYSNEEYVKIYTSGSFLDPIEVPVTSRAEIFETFSDARRILIESRPEFITDENISNLQVTRLEIAMGLESAFDSTLEKCVNKGFTVAEYERAARYLNERGIPLRTYLLLKPPFLNESAAILDTVESAVFASRFSESISINPVNVQKGTLVEVLWKRGDYRPPWLWSLVTVLSNVEIRKGVRIFSAPTGAGTLRGAHNCLKCDRVVLDAVKRHAFNQDPNEFYALDCSCKNNWKAQLEFGCIAGSSVNIERYIEYEMDNENTFSICGD
ncbi:MAG: archaeosine biosynthesis radical SAM protein RaSEA [Methanomassiliicoccales archaeon]